MVSILISKINSRCSNHLTLVLYYLEHLLANINKILTKYYTINVQTFPLHFLHFVILANIVKIAKWNGFVYTIKKSVNSKLIKRTSKFKKHYLSFLLPYLFLLCCFLTCPVQSKFTSTCTIIPNNIYLFRVTCQKAELDWLSVPLLKGKFLVRFQMFSNSLYSLTKIFPLLTLIH